MKLATWNVNSLRVRQAQVVDWLQSAEVDLLGLQEIKLEDLHFPEVAFKELGYQATWPGQKTYNGVALLSRLPFTEVEKGLPGVDPAQSRLIAATVGEVRVVNIYVPNGESLSSAKYLYKLEWLNALSAYLALQLQRYPRLVVMGDFNIAPTDADVYDPLAWQNSVLCSQPEREAFQHLLALPLKDSFRLFEQPPQSYSWWDYRAAGFRRNLGLRIDHILLSAGLVQRCMQAQIDKAPRAWERPSDHAPMWLTLADS